MLSLGEIAGAITGARLLPGTAADIRIECVSTDSRTIGPGALFVALRGPRFDGHDYIDAALGRGASAVICERTAAGEGRAIIVVPDALLALQQLATHWRRRWRGPLIAVTGSNGKTSVTRMIACILAAQHGADAYWATPGNLNNHIGVPLTLLGLRERHRRAVIELGMNHPGEIAVLSAIAEPTVALVNNAQREHQEFMHSVMATALENGEVFRSLPADGRAIHPRDPAHEAAWASLAAGHGRLRFGFVTDPADASYGGEEVLVEPIPAAGAGAIRLHLPGEGALCVQLRAMGRHVARNAAAAASCALAAGCTSGAIAAGLAAFEPVPGRGNVLALAGGGRVVDDTYNANPDSVVSAIEGLAELPGPRALVLGDMGETGDESPAFHREALELARGRGLDGTWLHGDAFGKAQAAVGTGRHFPVLQALLADLGDWIAARQAEGCEPSVWVKGSRSMHMERVVAALAVDGGSRMAEPH